MKLTERLNVLIQATTLSQKSGILTLDEAVKAKTAIDIITAGVINQNFTAAINVLIEIVVSSHKKGVYSLKDAHMIYLAIEGIEGELQNEVNRMNTNLTRTEVDNTPVNNPHVLNSNVPESTNNSGETVVNVAPIKLKKKS